MAALESGAFDQIVLLSGRQAPGRIETIVPIEDFMEELVNHKETDTVRDVHETHRNTFDCGSRHMAGNIGVTGPWKKGDSALTG